MAGALGTLLDTEIVRCDAGPMRRRRLPRAWLSPPCSPSLPPRLLACLRLDAGGFVSRSQLFRTCRSETGVVPARKRQQGGSEQFGERVSSLVGEAFSFYRFWLPGLIRGVSAIPLDVSDGLGVKDSHTPSLTIYTIYQVFKGVLLGCLRVVCSVSSFEHVSLLSSMSMAHCVDSTALRCCVMKIAESRITPQCLYQ